MVEVYQYLYGYNGVVTTKKILKGSIKYIVFFLILAYVSQWMTINLYLTSLGQKQQGLTEVKDSPLFEVIKSKTGLTLNSFQIIASTKLYAVMIGVPGKPYMMLSSKLNQDFTDSEKEYVVLHETGHYLLHHSIMEALFFALLFILGCFLIRKRPWYFIPIIGILFGLIYIQFGMRSEYEADHYAVTHITDPQGMISATEKFKYQNFPPKDDTGIKWRLLYRSVPYQERIEIAKQEMAIRDTR